MNAYTPSEYAVEVWHGKITDKTVRNWIRKGKMPKGCRVETTPTGHYIIYVDQVETSNVANLVKAMEAQMKMSV